MMKRRIPHPGGRRTLGYGAKTKRTLFLTQDAWTRAEAIAQVLTARAERAGLEIERVSVSDAFEAAIRVFNPRRFTLPAPRR
jgi:hypothetical protein